MGNCFFNFASCEPLSGLELVDAQLRFQQKQYLIIGLLQNKSLLKLILVKRRNYEFFICFSRGNF